MSYTKVIYEVKNRVAKITLNDPDRMNPLGGQLTEDMLAALAEAKEDANVKAIVLTGAGRAFCAGGDVTSFKDVTVENTYEMMKAGSELVGAFMDNPKPIIASVNGYAVGAGFSLALLSDFVIASDKAKFGLAFINIGLVPDAGGMWLLPRIVGLMRAKELQFTGKNIDAQEAYRMGIVNTVVEHDKLADATTELSEKIAGQPGGALAQGKRILNLSMDMDMQTLLGLERYAQSVCMASDDCQEAVKAFVEKRKPVFK